MMSFGGKSTKADVPQFKQFVSEEEIAETKTRRQEEWERVRKPHQPLEAPEEVYDPRSLFDKLEEQKQKKQDEHDEQFNLKNQVQGLGEDEAEFLDYVSSKQQEAQQQREQEEKAFVVECKEAMVVDRTLDQSHKPTQSRQPRPGPTRGKASQMALLAGGVKRKVSGDGDKSNGKQARTDANGSAAKEGAAVSSGSVATDSSAVPDASADNKEETGVRLDTTGVARVVGVLPGLGVYTDSSDSSESSEEEENHTDVFTYQQAVLLAMAKSAQGGH